jgi:hypothetical protein
MPSMKADSKFDSAGTATRASSKSRERYPSEQKAATRCRVTADCKRQGRFGLVTECAVHRGYLRYN